MEFWDLLKHRKSIRSFHGTRMPLREDIEKIIKAATYAPSNCNQQLWNFIVIKDAKTKERLVTEAASNTLFRRAPILVCVTYDGWNFKEAIQGAALAVGNMLLAASDVGLGSLPMNSYGNDMIVKKILKIPDQEIICCFVVLGYPDGKAENSALVPRRPVQEVIHWENFNEKKRIIPFTYNPNDWTIEDIREHQRYYCRKTSSGKEMDICGDLEKQLVSKIMENTNGRILDLLSYDGSYLRLFPNKNIITFDLSSETRDYTHSAIKDCGLTKVDHLVLDGELPQAKTISLIYKLERLPHSYAGNLLTKSYKALEEGGNLIIISRRFNLWFRFLFFILTILFGGDLRKTGVYNFFGPYRPISLHKTIGVLKHSGFKEIEWQGYFLFPVFYELVYQMYLQYKKSGGTSYLHREKRQNILTKIIAGIISIQGLKRCGRFGSVVVIKCRK